MSKKTRLKTASLDEVPQDLGQVNAAVAEIGTCQRERERIQTEMNENLTTIRSEYEAMAAPHAERISVLTKGVHAYCEAHRDALTKQGKVKTARLATGIVAWRTRPPSVRLRGKKEAVIELLTKLKLKRFLRVKTDIDREAILRDPEAVAGVQGISISKGEDFSITPDATQLEEIR